MKVALPEQVWIEYRVAGFGSRALAYIVDFLIRWTVISAVVFTTLYLVAVFAPSGYLIPEFIRSWFSEGNSDRIGTVVMAVIVAIIFLVEWSYPVFFEVRQQGMTPGKSFFGLRVVDEHGLPITFQASALRTLLLIVDALPVFGLVGLLSMLVTQRSQRLGDLVAKTMVIYDSERSALSKNNNRNPAHVIVLPGQHYRILEQALARKNELSPEAFHAMASDLVLLLKPFVQSSAIAAECPWEDHGKALQWIKRFAEPKKEIATNGARR